MGQYFICFFSQQLNNSTTQQLNKSTPQQINTSTNKMYTLGISCYYHDSAAALLRNGEIIAAAQEERFTRVKHDSGFPAQAIDYCLRAAGITAQELNAVAFYDKPLLKFERILETHLSFAPRGIRSFWKAMPVWLKQKLWVPSLIREQLGYQGKILFPQHHQSHAASAFFPSPFESAAILTMDGVGEWATTTIGQGDAHGIRLLKEMRFPHSPGLLYSAFTYFTGFKVNSGEYKLMGLAPYGKPKYVDQIYSELIDLKDDGSFALNMDYFDFAAGLRMTNDKFANLFGGPARRPESALTQREMDLARSVQEVTGEIMLRMARHAHELTNEKYLALAGGVALNCVANGRLLREGPFDDIWIQPAAGDAGGAVGAAMLAHYQRNPGSPRHKNSESVYLGPEFSADQISAFLESRALPAELLTDAELNTLVAELLAAGKVVGWFQGAMEFGPRALGNRSILADARSVKMQSQLNLKIKYRESFRPFAPAVLAERVSEWFDLDRPSPYMLLVANVAGDKQVATDGDGKFGLELLHQQRSQIPAVTHVDYSARIQTVHKETNPRFHALLSEFHNQTGCPVLVNTSFNVRGEPIVNTPEDAWRCFMRTEMDVLVLGNYLLHKDAQAEWNEEKDWKKEFALD